MIVSALSASAQFYYTGRGSARTKWSQINNGKYRLIFPEDYTIGAARYASILDSIYPYINYNFELPVRKVPIVLRTENQLSNGYVVWAPKHEEIVTNLSGNTYALSWAKQVAIHEARHVAQMSLMKRGLTKIATWLLGEAGISTGLLVVSKWQLEGDATLAETQMAEYGRGLQPNFTLGYRGLAADGKLNFRQMDPWVCGSYKHYVPDIYEFGYQLMSAAETYCSPTIWNDIVTYSAKYPILISPRTIYLKRHYNTSFNKITCRAFAELDSIWRPTYSIPNSFEVLTAEHKLHTNYTSPLPYGDRFVATKWDMKKPSRFIVIDTATMREKLLHSLGSVTSRPIITGDQLYWTEYKPHPIYEQKNFSAIRSINLKTGRQKVYSRWGVNYFVTPMEQGLFATITHDSQSNSYIRVTDSLFTRELNSYKFREPTTLHGLAYDNGRLYFIALDDRGMWIGSVSEAGDFKEVTAPSVVTVQDLTIANGRLYFSSIESGKNEIHTINLATGEQFRQTTSKLGSISATAIDSVNTLFSTYTPRGWAIARAELSDTTEVAWSRLPQNTLNPKRYKWDVPTNITVPKDTVTNKKSKRFRRALRAFNVHSWAPVSFAGSLAMSENTSIPIGLGASVFFQSTLSEMRGFASYGWMNDMNWLKASVAYTGLPVQLEVVAEYGGGKQLTYYPVDMTHTADLELKPYLGISATLSMPLDFSNGANSLRLVPSMTFTHYNSRFYKEETATFSSNVQTFNASLSWSSIQNKGYRSLMPRLGYTVRSSVVGAFNKDFSTIISLLARAYLPGFAQTHSLMITSTCQYQFEHNQYKLSSKSLVPRGITNNYAAKNYTAVQTSYTMPLAYPEWGWDGVLFIRRLSAEAFFDYSIGTYYGISGTQKLENHSSGIVLGIDNNLFTTLSNKISLTFANTSDQKFWFGFGIAFQL